MPVFPGMRTHGERLNLSRMCIWIFPRRAIQARRQLARPWICLELIVFSSAQTDPSVFTALIISTTTDLSSAESKVCLLISRSGKGFWEEALRMLLVYVRKREKYGNVDFNLNNKTALVIKDSSVKYLKEAVI